MEDKKNRIPGLITPQMGLLCLAGLLANLALAHMVLALNLPLFLDSVGTILVAALGGPLPGMAVGFASNLITSIADPISMYYGILSVFIALVAGIFSGRGCLKKIGGCLLAVLCFTAIGGAVGSCMTWMLYGGIGEGISAPMARDFLAGGLPEFWAQFWADILIDLPDKLLTMAPVYLFLHFYPKKLYNLFPYSYLYDRSPEKAQAAQRVVTAHYRKMSVKTRILASISVSAVVISVTSTAIGVMLDRQNQSDRYSELVNNAAGIAASVIDGDYVEEYLAMGEASAQYRMARKKLQAIKDNMTGVKYLYVYQIKEDGCHVVFDFDSGDVLAGETGDIVSFDTAFAPYLDDLLAGKEIPTVVENGQFGYLITAYVPVHDSTGKTVVYACADAAVDSLKETTLTYIIKMIAIQFGLSVLIIAFAIWYAQQRLVAPINAVVEQSEAFRRTDPEHWLQSDAWLHRTPVDSGDETEELYNTVCRVQEEVAENVTALRHSKELEQKNRELAVAIRQVEEANSAKSDFLSRMSHDIRTPLNGIIGMTEIARSDNSDPAVQKSLDLIASSSRFLLSLINDILDISKIENGSMELHERPVPLSEIDAMIDSVVRPLMNSKQIEFVYRMDCGLNCTNIDPVRFNQIFFNLLSNAAKFTPQGGRVEFLAGQLSSEGETEQVRFTVRDNGIGMRPEFIAHAFTPFEQDEENNGRQQNQGTGLGLAITKELVELMGGTITLQSTLGSGTCFTVDLPLRRVALPDESEQQQSRLQTETVLRGKRVLLAEDNHINAMVAQRLLENKGITVTQVENGELAVQAVATSAPGTFDAVLMDIRMPVLGGLDATRQIRLLPHPDAKNLPIIAMTANAFDEDVQECLAAGMNAHLAKPIEPDKLYATLAEFLQKAQNDAGE